MRKKISRARMYANFATERTHGSVHASQPEIWSHDKVPPVVCHSGA
jgi:hypothetical protein